MTYRIETKREKAEREQAAIDRKAEKSLRIGSFYQIEGRGRAGWLREVKDGRAVVQCPDGTFMEDRAGYLFPVEVKPCFFPLRMRRMDGSIDPEALKRAAEGE